MNITLKRNVFNSTSTLGELYINGTFFCHTLEDTDRNLSSTTPINIINSIKIKGKTAIPKGKYNIILNHSPRFNRVLPLLVDVPGFLGIRIHAGNTEVDTDGCILVGVKSLDQSKIVNSRVTLERLINELIKSKTPINITIL